MAQNMMAQMAWIGRGQSSYAYRILEPPYLQMETPHFDRVNAQMGCCGLGMLFGCSQVSKNYLPGIKTYVVPHFLQESFNQDEWKELVFRFNRGMNQVRRVYACALLLVLQHVEIHNFHASLTRPPLSVSSLCRLKDRGGKQQQLHCAHRSPATQASSNNHVTIICSCSPSPDMCLTEPVHWFFYTVAGGCCAEAAAMPHQTRLRTNVGPALASLCAELSTEKFEHKLLSLPCRACIVLAPTRHAVFCSSAQLQLSLLPQMMFTLLSFRLKWRIEVKASLEMPLDGREMPPEAFLVLEGQAVSNNPMSIVQGMPGMPNMMGMVSAVFVIFCAAVQRKCSVCLLFVR